MINFISDITYSLFDSEALFPKIILYDYVDNLSECIQENILQNKSRIDSNILYEDLFYSSEFHSNFFHNFIQKVKNSLFCKQLAINLYSVGSNVDENLTKKDEINSIMGCNVSLFSGLLLKLKIINCEIILETFFNSKLYTRNKLTTSYLLDLRNIIIIKEDQNFEKILENYFFSCLKDNINSFNNLKYDDDRLAYFIDNFLIKNEIDIIFLIGNTCTAKIKSLLSYNGIFVIDYLNTENYEVLL